MKSCGFYSTSSRTWINIRKVYRLPPSTLLCILKMELSFCAIWDIELCESFVLLAAKREISKITECKLWNILVRRCDFGFFHETCRSYLYRRISDRLFSQVHIEITTRCRFCVISSDFKRVYSQTRTAIKTESF